MTKVAHRRYLLQRRGRQGVGVGLVPLCPGPGWKQMPTWVLQSPLTSIQHLRHFLETTI